MPMQNGQQASDSDEKVEEQVSSKSYEDVPNTEFAKQSYWDERFAEEDSYEWLVSYKDVASHLQPILGEDFNLKILIVGCGNSSFSMDLYDAGYTQITNIDYSPVVIENMKLRNQNTRPGMEWKVMDMTKMTDFDDSIFDVIIDKSAMDALMTEEGDVWSPSETVIAKARSMCRHISRLLKAKGHHLQISFEHPRFRKKYLLGVYQDDGSQVPVRKEDFSDEFDWSFGHETIGGKDGSFHHFLYIMQKSETSVQ